MTSLVFSIWVGSDSGHLKQTQVSQKGVARSFTNVLHAEAEPRYEHIASPRAPGDASPAWVCSKTLAHTGAVLAGKWSLEHSG